MRRSDAGYCTFDFAGVGRTATVKIAHDDSRLNAQRLISCACTARPHDVRVNYTSCTGTATYRNRCRGTPTLLQEAKAGYLLATGGNVNWDSSTRPQARLGGEDQSKYKTVSGTLFVQFSRRLDPTLPQSMQLILVPQFKQGRRSPGPKRRQRRLPRGWPCP